MIDFINTSEYPLYRFIEDLKRALAICSATNSTLQKFIPKIRKILSGAKIVGYHLMQGQSRLDAESLTSTAENILKLQVPAPQGEGVESGVQMIEYMLGHQSTIFAREHELNYEDLRIFRHFKLQSYVNKFNNRHIPKLVIANFTSHLDFLSGFFLLHQTQNLRTEGSAVRHSKVKMIPLLESTSNFYMFPGIVQKLLTVDLVRNYIEWYKEMVFMIACSDTPRENGAVAANSAIMTCLRQINDTFLKGIHLGPQLNQERLALGKDAVEFGLIRSGAGAGAEQVEAFWERVYSQNKIVYEDNYVVEIENEKEGCVSR